jgi:hypothetical protein
MGRVSSTHRRDEKCIQNFGWKTCRCPMSFLSPPSPPPESTGILFSKGTQLLPSYKFSDSSTFTVILAFNITQSIQLKKKIVK